MTAPNASVPKSIDVWVCPTCGRLSWASLGRDHMVRLANGIHSVCPGEPARHRYVPAEDYEAALLAAQTLAQRVVGLQTEIDTRKARVAAAMPHLRPFSDESDARSTEAPDA